VFSEHGEDDRIMGLHSSVTPLHAVPAEHHEVFAQVVAGMLVDVMKGKPAPRLETDSALSPLAMKLA
jgi:hypothetical protein